MTVTNPIQPTAPVTVGIPTYSRGDCVFRPIERLLQCTPPPAEIIVHIDASDGALAQRLTEAFPTVRILSSPHRVGPGGGRHRCLRAATQPFFASFDDDSWPVDPNFFGRVVKHFEEAPQAGALATIISHRHEVMPPVADRVTRKVNYTGCGHALRLEAYRSISGYIDRPNAYGMEERDICLQLHVRNWDILECEDLRVFHDTDLKHHASPEITASTIENAALFPFLRYPALLWPYGALQYLNLIYFLLKKRRFHGICRGVLRSPLEMWRHRHLRTPFPIRCVLSFLQQRRV